MAITKSKPVQVPASAKDDTAQDKREEMRIVGLKKKIADAPKTKAMLQQRMKDLKGGKQTPPVKIPEEEKVSHQDTKEQIRIVLAKLRQNPDPDTKKELINRLKELSAYHKRGEDMNEVEVVEIVKKVINEQDPGLQKAIQGIRMSGTQWGKSKAGKEAAQKAAEAAEAAGEKKEGVMSTIGSKIKSALGMESEDTTAVDPVKDYVAQVSTQGAHAAAISTGLGALELRKILAARNNS